MLHQKCPGETSDQRKLQTNPAFFLTVRSIYGLLGYAKVHPIRKAAELAPVALQQLKNPAS